MKNGRVTSGNQRRLFSIEEHLFRKNPKEYRAYRTCFIIIEIPFQRHGRVVCAIAEYYTSFSISLFDVRYISKINFARFSPRWLDVCIRNTNLSSSLSLPNNDSRRRRKSRAARFSGKKRIPDFCWKNLKR